MNRRLVRLEIEGDHAGDGARRQAGAVQGLSGEGAQLVRIHASLAAHTQGQHRGMEDKLGTLVKGKLADVLIVAENPLTDIQNVRKMRMVITDGRVVRDRLRGSSATEE